MTTGKGKIEHLEGAVLFRKNEVRIEVFVWVGVAPEKRHAMLHWKKCFKCNPFRAIASIFP